MQICEGVEWGRRSDKYYLNYLFACKAFIAVNVTHFIGAANTMLINII